MADENVTIKIDTDADTRGIDKARRKLLALSAQSQKIGQMWTKSTNALKFNTRELDLNAAAAKAAGKQIGGMGKTASKVAKMFGTVFKLALMGSAIETAALALALSSVNGFLAVGKLLSRGWSATINGLGVAAANAAAAVGVLVAVFTAAMRQYSAAQASFAYGGDFAASSSALRQMQTDSQLAVFGLQSVTAAFVTASRNTKVSSTTVKAIGGLSDFVVASGDMEKGLSSVAEIVSLLESGKSSGDIKVLDAAKQLGPVFEDAYKKATASGTKSTQEILKMFSTGELAAAAGIAGTANNVRGTLMGQLKAFAVDIQTTFADMGANFIKPIQEAFEEIRRTIFRMTVEVSGSLNSFAQGPFTNFLTKSMDVMAGWIAKLVNVWLPKTEEVFNNFINGWNKMTSTTRRFFQRFELFLKKYTDASKIINTFFGIIFKRGFGDAIGRNFKSFSDLIIENQDNFLDFGEAIGSLVSSIINFFGELRESFMQALPAINFIVDAITGLVNALSSLVNLMQGGGSLGALASLFLPMALIGGGGAAMGKGGKAGKMGIIQKLGMAAGVTGLGAVGMNSEVAANILGVGGVAAYAGSKMKNTKLGNLITNAGQVPKPVAVGGFPGFSAVVMDPSIPDSQLTPQQRGQRLRMRNMQAAGLSIQPQPAVTSASRGSGVLSSARQMRGGGRVLGSARKVGGSSMGSVALPAMGIMATNEIAKALEGQFSNTGMSIGGSAAGGAAIGAVVGSIVPIIGTGIGAAAGAAIGAVLGFVQSGKAKKQAEESGAALTGMYSDGIVDLMRRGGFDEARQAIADFNGVVSDNAKNIGRSSEFEKSARESFAKELEDTINPALEQYDRNVNDLSKASGKSNKEIVELANSMGIDLTSNIMSVTDMLAKMELAVRRVGEEFDAAFASIIGQAASEMRQELAVLNAPKIMDEAAESFRQLLSSGTQTDDDIVDFLETLALQSQTMFKGDSLGAFEYMLANIGEGGSQFQAGGVFAGLDPSIFGDFLTTFTESSEKGLRDIVAENIIATLSAQGKGFADQSPAQIANALSRLDSKELIDLGRRSQEEDFLKNSAELTEIFGRTMQLTETEEAKFGLGVDEFGKKTAEFREGVGVLKNGTDTFEAAVNKFAETVANFNPRGGRRGDTPSPRRNLVNTLSQHGRFDMGIAGSRSITSAFRTDNLGSMSSDHAAGRAYDLTGNNLGLYKTSVLDAGGYADFHGAGGSRHLHVVPPEGPVGDRTTPYMGSMVSSGGSSEFNYNITVNASEGMDEMALADLVVERIERKQRMMSERR
jgi:hypothetical protein